jgi:hypothetical protein
MLLSINPLADKLYYFKQIGEKEVQFEKAGKVD